MSTSSKTESANRHHGGPGSSHQRADRPDPTADRKPAAGESTNGPDSRVSGGGGEKDRKHSHDPGRK